MAKKDQNIIPVVNTNPSNIPAVQPASTPFYKDPKVITAAALGLISIATVAGTTIVKEKIKTKEAKKRHDDRIAYEKALAQLKLDTKNAKREAKYGKFPGIEDVPYRPVEESRVQESPAEKKWREFIEQQEAQKKMMEAEVVISSSNNADAPKRVSEMSAHTSVGLEYILGKFFEKGEISMLCGRTSMGKTYALYHILYSIAAGTSSGLFDDEIENGTHVPNQVIAYLGESSEGDIRSRFADHPNLRIFTKEQCAEFEQDVDKLVASVRNQVANLNEGTDCTIGLDNMAKLCNESSNWTKVDKLYNGLESVIAEAKKRNVTVSVILIAHTNTDSKKPSLSNFKGLQSKVNLCKNILEIYPCGLGSEYKMLIPLKCKYDNNLQEKAYIIKQYKSDVEPQKLFEFVETMDLNDALNLGNVSATGSTLINSGADDTYEDDIDELAVDGDGHIYGHSLEELVVGSKGKGRPKSVSDETIQAITNDIQNGMSKNAACKKYHVSRDAYNYRMGQGKVRIYTNVVNDNNGDDEEDE
ncbi:MAG: hypothetical protein KBT22_01735 [Bacteroidales bacterium]|nr:hypothetical protein [Candidatus Scybalocola fimicaballi]